MPIRPSPRLLLEYLPKTKLRGFNVNSFQKPCVDFHWHSHPELELIFIEKGRGILSFGQSLVPYAAGDLFLLGAHLPHAFGSHPEERTGAAWTVFHFLPEIFGENFWRLPDNRAVRRLLSQSQKGIRFAGKSASACRVLLHRLEKKSSGTAPLSLVLELLNRLTRIRNACFLHASGLTPARDLPIDPRLRKLLPWIDRQAENPDLTQSAAARHVNLSPQAFCRFFRRNVGRCFHRYLNELRVARACSALLTTEKNISEIAYSAGFNNLSNFNRRFHELVGRTPLNYRRFGEDASK